MITKAQWQRATYGYGYDETRPRLEGAGPAECSSCTALSVLPGVIWDVNGYYRELGVSPHATRRELREAYMAKDGQSSARLTYIMKQLVNREIRFAYDCVPLGEVFVDAYVAEALKREAMKRKSKRMQDLHDAGADMDRVDPEGVERDVYAEMGFDESFFDTPSETVDGDIGSGQDQPRPADRFSYAYYLYRVHSWISPEDIKRLGDWQRFLVTAFAREGITHQFSVGFHGNSPHRWLFTAVGARKAFLLGYLVDPDELLAAQAAQQYRRDLDVQQQFQPLATTGR